MTNYTPQQEESLNRAIWKVDTASYSGSMERGFIVHTPKNYTRDLNAIVEVVQRWCRKTLGHAKLQSACWDYKIIDTPSLLLHKQPALALCIAFAKAAGLEWEEQNG